jgi:hypothetical protein
MSIVDVKAGLSIWCRTGDHAECGRVGLAFCRCGCHAPPPNRAKPASAVSAPKPRRRRPAISAFTPPRRPTVREVACCAARVDEAGRYPIGFCSPECERRPR